MDCAPPERVCGSCGARIETRARALEPADCGPCAAAGDRRDVLARLRRLYRDARLRVSTPPGGSPTHAHLEWILGARRNVELDDTIFEGDLSELVVLWLEDLAVDVEQADGASRAAADLRLATRAFAETFLDPMRSERP